jgi:beta-lactamase class D
MLNHNYLMKRFNPYTALLSLVFFSFACTTHRADIDNSLKKYFDKNNVEGCFTMLNNGTGEVTVYNLASDTTRFSPASTFNIVHSLIGLQTGRILNDTMIIKWDGVKRPVEAWNKDMGMKEAFKVDCVPYYQEVARQIGAENIQKWVDSLNYGNKHTGTAVDSFWLNNTLKISADEQLGFAKRLYFDQLPFRKTVQQNLRQALLQEENTLYKLSYITGRGYDENHKAQGWVVGWIEENQHVYFFVTFARAPGDRADMAAISLNITRDILTKMDLFSGKK